MEIEQMRIRMGEMAAEIDRLQSIIDGQQSPAVAVPDSDGVSIIEAALKKVSSGNLAEAPFPLTGENAQCYLNGAASAYQHALEMICISSPRITEQDAREIVGSVIRYCNTRKNVAWDTESYMRETGSDLLTKLNEANHSAYDPIQLLETARTALADIANAKDLTLEAAQRKAKRIYREIRQAMDGEENVT